MMPAGTTPFMGMEEGAAPVKAVEEVGAAVEVTAGVVGTWTMELDGVGWLELLGVNEGTETDVVEGVGVDVVEGVGIDVVEDVGVEVGTLTISTVTVEVWGSPARAKGARAAEAMRRALLKCIVT